MEEFSILVDFKPCGSLTKDIYVISIEIFSSAIHCIPARSSIVNWNRIGQSEIFSSVFNARPLWSDIIVNHHHHYHHHYHHNPPTYHSFHIINIERFLSGTQSWKSSALGNTSFKKKCFLSGIARMRGGGMALPELKNTLYIFLYDGRKRFTSCPKEGEGGAQWETFGLHVEIAQLFKMCTY